MTASSFLLHYGRTHVSYLTVPVVGALVDESVGLWVVPSSGGAEVLAVSAWLPRRVERVVERGGGASPDITNCRETRKRCSGNARCFRLILQWRENDECEGSPFRLAHVIFGAKQSVL